MPRSNSLVIQPAQIFEELPIIGGEKQPKCTCGMCPISIKRTIYPNDAYVSTAKIPSMPNIIGMAISGLGLGIVISNISLGDEEIYETAVLNGQGEIIDRTQTSKLETAYLNHDNAVKATSEHLKMEPIKTTEGDEEIMLPPIIEL